MKVGPGIPCLIIGCPKTKTAYHLNGRRAVPRQFSTIKHLTVNDGRPTPMWQCFVEGETNYWWIEPWHLLPIPPDGLQEAFVAERIRERARDATVVQKQRDGTWRVK